MLITRFYNIVLFRARALANNELQSSAGNGLNVRVCCMYVLCVWERQDGTRETKHAATTFQRRSLVEIYNLGLDSWLQRVPTRRSRRHNISRRPAGWLVIFFLFFSFLIIIIHIYVYNSHFVYLSARITHDTSLFNIIYTFLLDKNRLDLSLLSSFLLDYLRIIILRQPNTKKKKIVVQSV